MSETNMIEATLYVVWNEDGDMTADTDRDTAFKRLNDDFDGHELRCIEMTISVPRPVDLKVSITLPDVAPKPVEVTIES